MKTSEFKAEVRLLLEEHGSIKGVQNYFIKEADEFPVEKKMLYPGKLYVFNYMTDKKQLFDTFPFIISLGPSKKSAEKFYGLDLRYIPFNMRVDVMANIYNQFESVIDKEIEQYYDSSSSLLQQYIPELSTDNINQIAGLDLKTAVHSYDIHKISNLRCVNYRMAFAMCYCDENWFENGSIKDAQQKFLMHL